MAHTYDELSKMTVVQLREIADGIEHEATKGHSTMHKEKLLPALCIALGIEAHVHHQVVGLNKDQIKAEIRGLKEKRAAAIESHNGEELKQVRHKIRNLKRLLRKSIV